MTCTYRWANTSQNTIFLEDGTLYSWYEVYNLARDLHAAITSVDHTVDLVVVPSAKWRITSGNMLAHMRRMLAQVPENLGTIYILQPMNPPTLTDKLIQSTLQFASRVIHREGLFRFVESPEALPCYVEMVIPA